MPTHAGAAALLLMVTHALGAAGGAVLSYPPLRPLPPPSARPMGKGAAFFVDPVKGNDANDGGRDHPWKTINHSLTQLSAGDTLYLRGGSYFENVYCAVKGQPEKPITIRSYPGETAVIDGGLPEFQTDPQNAWTYFPDGVAGEFVSARPYKNIRDVVGLFGDSNIGLQTYWYPMDLRSDSELWIPDEKQYIKPVYCGPGLWYEKDTGLIHVRLAHTKLKTTEQDHYPNRNYGGETDPRKLPLVISPFNAVALLVDQAMYVRFQDLVIRGGGYVTVNLRFGVAVEFDHCFLYGGTYVIWAKNTGPLKMTHCGVHGMIPPWAWRSENCLFSYSPVAYPPFVGGEFAPQLKGLPWRYKRPRRLVRHVSRLPTHAIMVTAGAYEFETFAHPHNHDWDISYCEFTDGHDGVYLSGHTIRFHHNWIDTVQDDPIYISSPTARYTHSVYIHQNYISSGVCGFSAHQRGGPGGDVYVYRNIVDLRKRIQYSRPSLTKPEGTYGEGHSMYFRHGGQAIHEENLYFYHNVSLTRTFGFAASMWAVSVPDAARRSFNNICIYRQGYGRRFYPAKMDFTGFDLQMDHNLHWSLEAGEEVPEGYVEKIRKHPLSEGCKDEYPSGLAAHSFAADPRFVRLTDDRNVINDYRLQDGSPAIGKGRILPADWPDPLRRKDDSPPDIGAIPFGGEQLKVGIEARIIAGCAGVPGRPPAAR